MSARSKPWFDAGLGVGHVWTEVTCPAYASGNGADCACMSWTCRDCGNAIRLVVDWTGQRGRAWLDVAWPRTETDDRGFQCGLSVDGRHHLTSD